MLSFSNSPFDDDLQTKVKTIKNLRVEFSMTASGNCASEIIPRLYLSDLATACNYDTITRLGITHMISILDWDPQLLPPESKISHLYIPLSDRFDANILDVLPRTTVFIQNALEMSETNKVLVHCMMGVSRSATLVCAYLVSRHKMSVSQAVAFTKEQRPVVRPNIGFRKQLDDYAQQFPWGTPSSPKVVSQLRKIMERYGAPKVTVSNSMAAERTSVTGPPDAAVSKSTSTTIYSPT